MSTDPGGHKDKTKGPLYRRIVVKVGTNLLTSDSDHLDLGIMDSLVSQLAHLHRQGVQVLLVTSGAVAAGRHLLDPSGERPDTSFRQILAAVGQSRLMHSYEELFQRHSVIVAQALLTRGDLSDRVGYLNVRNTLSSLLDLGVVPIINENDVVAIEEIAGETFGDNDTLSALVANLIDADLLILLSDVSGLHTADPHKEPGARLIPIVKQVDASIEALAGQSWSSRSRGGMATKIEAAKLATAAGIPVAIASGREADVVKRLVDGEPLGTFFVHTASKMESRKRWMVSGLSTKGAIQVDHGAVKAIREQNRSLLPAGIKEIQGPFQRGDIVYILGEDGARLACGITNYSSEDIEKIKGQRSNHISKSLGYHYGEEVVHRNNMVLI